MDSKLDKIAITEMAKTRGWQQLKADIEKDIERWKERLVSTDPSDVEKIVEYQTCIKSSRTLLYAVDSNIIKS